jgi:hypothetical protein
VIDAVLVPEAPAPETEEVFIEEPIAPEVAPAVEEDLPPAVLIVPEEVEVIEAPASE